MDYVSSQVLQDLNKTPERQQQLKLVVHGPEGSGKSVTLRAIAHQLTQAGVEIVMTTPNAIIASSINEITSNLPMTNNKRIKSTEGAPLRSAQLENENTACKHTKVLLLDDMNSVSDKLLETIERRLRLNTRQTETPFGGIHIVMFNRVPLPQDQQTPTTLKQWQNFHHMQLQGNQRTST